MVRGLRWERGMREGFGTRREGGGMSVGLGEDLAGRCFEGFGMVSMNRKVRTTCGFHGGRIVMDHELLLLCLSIAHLNLSQGT